MSFVKNPVSSPSRPPPSIESDAIAWADARGLAAPEDHGAPVPVALFVERAPAPRARGRDRLGERRSLGRRLGRARVARDPREIAVEPVDPDPCALAANVDERPGFLDELVREELAGAARTEGMRSSITG